jgi:predicted NAD/FAD-dependent oxidoreductase
MGDGLFSISSQHSQKKSQAPSWTIVMDANWSKAHFEKEENQILSEACDLVIKRMPQLRFKAVHLKKWRYCQPLKIWHRLFENPLPNLFLAGDAFGGPSLQGALRSSQGLFAHLQKRLPG